MRLSRALWVMLLLHVVAIGGVLTFGKIKEGPAGNRADARPGARGASREDPRSEVADTEAVHADHAPTPFPSVPPPRPAVAPVPPARANPTPTLSRVEADAVRLIESGGPNPQGPGERSYVVGRGETVQHIAQKLRVEPAALMRLNNIDDPRKIQVGQRLRVPPPPPAGRARS